MTLLHYASKSGAAGIGDPEIAADMVSMLLSKGADPNIRCRWTHMTALHYAAYFDVVPVIKILLKATKALGMYLFRRKRVLAIYWLYVHCKVGFIPNKSTFCPINFCESQILNYGKLINIIGMNFLFWDVMDVPYFLGY